MTMLPRTDVGDKEENLMMSKYKLIIDITKNMMQIDSIVVSLKPFFFFLKTALSNYHMEYIIVRIIARFLKKKKRIIVYLSCVPVSLHNIAVANNKS